MEILRKTGAGLFAAGVKRGGRWAGPSLLAVTVITTALPNQASAQGEVFTGVTLFQEGTELSFRSIYLERSRGSVSDVTNLSIRSHILLANTTYGISSDLTAGITLPFLLERQSFRTADGSNERVRNEGLGDISLSLKRRILRIDDVQRSHQVALIGGVKVPTGDRSVRGRGLSLGTGSWDPFVAVGWSEGWQYWDFDLSAFYKLNTEGARDIEEGDESVLEAELAYYPVRKAFPGPEYQVGLNLAWVHEFQDRVDGRRDRHSGGDRVYLTPFFSLAPRPDLRFEVAFSYPVIEDLRGDQLGENWRVSIALSYRF